MEGRIMDERQVAATLTAAVFARSELTPGRDPVQVVSQIYRRMLRSVRKVNQKEAAGDTQAPAAAVKA